MALVRVSHIDPKYRLGRTGTGGPSQHEMAQRQVPVVCEIAEGGWATTMGHEVNFIINFGHASNFNKIPGGCPPFATDGRSFHGNDRQTRPDPSQYANVLPSPKQKGGRPVPYTVQINLDEANLFGRMSEIDEWLRGRGFSPDVRQTRMTLRQVYLGLDFPDLGEANDFTNYFSEATLIV